MSTRLIRVPRRIGVAVSDAMADIQAAQRAYARVVLGYEERADDRPTGGLAPLRWQRSLTGWRLAGNVLPNGERQECRNC